MAQQRSAATGPDRFLIGIVGGVVLLIVLGVVVVLTMGRPRPAPPADANGPAAVVQAYVEAIRAGNTEKARTYLSREALTAEQSRNRPPYASNVNDNVRILVEPVSSTEDTADVRITISSFNSRSEPFSASSSNRSIRVRLVREDGAWRVNQPLEPYQVS
jgi:hypothetical protein